MNVLNLVSPTATSTNTSTLVAGSILNATVAMSVSFTVTNTGSTNSVDYLILAGNASDLSDGVTIQNSATLAHGAVGSYSVSTAPFGYYAVKIASTSAGNHTTVSVIGRAKG
jgi:hypothetical protein